MGNLGNQRNCSLTRLTQLSMNFLLLINMKMPLNVGIFIFMSIENFISNLLFISR